MKKIFGLLICVLFLTSCDDGDLVVETFNFDSVDIQKCDDPGRDPLFKINGEELLLLDIPASYFTNEVTPEGQPRIATISSTNRVIYRKYSGEADDSVICSDVPPASPSVQQEWNAAAGGTIEIVTTEVTTTDPETNEVTITGYKHQIKFKTIEFVGSQNSFVYDEYLFGDYEITL
ncbi:hypothetical protein FLJC2902T_26060 [Flavobacterium limnosediminis JC2902]|uniref:Lipoprotein n=1 Tax=Flavobacterium limnosediminis JC2902 TaxID=1341181 RepID=V6SJ62_9FLAO|nr:hypothetical protein [Flavobacterium limnosediminis]ESU26631.1 hypothetical protein FLJC2902T_26060 [Flavobacterium limnosediminis JC2902]